MSNRKIAHKEEIALIDKAIKYVIHLQSETRGPEMDEINETIHKSLIVTKTVFKELKQFADKEIING